jgi:SH3-like domain-containing protein
LLLAVTNGEKMAREGKVEVFVSLHQEQNSRHGVQFRIPDLDECNTQWCYLNITSKAGEVGEGILRFP